MSTSGKAAKLVLAIVIPALAGAQAPQQAKPSPQVGSAAPAAHSSTTVTPGQKTQPAVSPRYVTSESFYRPPTKPQTAIPVPLITRPAQPVIAASPNTTPVPVQATPIAAIPQVQGPQVQAPQAAQPVTASSTGNALVDYASGQLSVVSDDAPLGYVLKEIAAKTGAVVDIAPELQNERVVARLGPASVREILTRLLDSPQIDYIVLGTGDEPGSLQRIVVRTRGRAGQIAMAGARQPQATSIPANFEQQSQMGMNGPINAAQTQRMENWQKAREEMRLAEIRKQAQERANEQNNPSYPDPPAIENNQPVDPPQNNQAGNPPQL
ncbi:MAG TPA: hypothetical protein VJW55_15700 [Candidatus Angelobacter sp.]|nr:hypothetical protein [Candidatus Angelobacter sp.]